MDKRGKNKAPLAVLENTIHNKHLGVTDRFGSLSLMRVCCGFSARVQVFGTVVSLYAPEYTIGHLIVPAYITEEYKS